jgi:predicted nucleotidyltransferase
VVTIRQIQEVADRIVRHFKPHKVILFGSRAYGRPYRDSDVDLVVVMPYRGRALTQTVKILGKCDPPFATDLLVYRPQEFRERYRQFDPFVRHAVDRGKVLYDRRSKGVGGQGRALSRQRQVSCASERIHSTTRYAFTYNSALRN